jgi:two-component system sensor histidine kinase/response regulator
VRNKTGGNIELKKLAQAAHRTRNGIVITNPEEKIIWVNAAFTDLTGYTLQEAIGEKPGELLQRPGPENDEARARIRKAMAERSSFREKLLNYAKSGKSYIVEVSGDPIFDEAGNFEGFVAFQYDVTERIESRLRDEQYERSLRKINETILSLGADFQKNLEKLTALAGELFQADCALYNRMEGDLLVSRGQWQTPPGYNPRDKPYGHLCFDVINSEEGFLHLRDLPNTPYFESDPNVSLYGLQTYIGHRVHFAGRSLGSVCVVFGRDVELTDGMQALLSIVADAIGREELLNETRRDLDLEKNRLASLLESLAGGVIVEDKDRNVVLANRSIESLLGFPPQALLGQNCTILAQEACQAFADPDMFIQSTAEIIKNWVPVSGHSLRLRDGRWVERDFVPLNLNEEAAGMMWHYRDVTESVRSLRIFRAVAEAGQAVLETRLLGEGWTTPLRILGEAVYTDRTYVFRAHPHPQNGDSAVSQVGEWCAKGISPQINSPDLQNIPWKEFSPRWEQELNQGHVVVGNIADFPAGEQPLLKAQGIQSILIVPITVRHKLWGFIGYDHCRTARRWLKVEIDLLRTASATIGLRIAQEEDEADLEKARAAAEGADRAKSRFLATMSHEIRTPLNGILGYTQLLLQNDDLASNLVRQVETIQRSGNHLLTLINDILDLSKIEADQVHLSRDPVDLANLGGEIIEILESVAARKNIQLGFDLVIEAQSLSTGRLIIQSDNRALRQILINLVGNAVKFTNEGAVRLSIKVDRLWSGPSRVLFSVEDTGIGISEEDQGNLFNPFQQIESARGHEEGTGLGLAISKKLVNLLGGDLICESEVGKGSIFSFTLSLNAKWEEGESGEPESKENRHTPGSAIKGYTGRRRRILVVDDVTDNRAVLRDVLGPIGFDLEEARNGIEALNKIKGAAFDLILSDLVMPFMDGFELVRRIRSDQATQNYKIFAVTASVMESSLQMAAERQFFDNFIEKPINTELLIRKIGDALSLEWIEETPNRLRPSAEGISASRFNSPQPEKEVIERIIELAELGDVAALKTSLERFRPAYPEWAGHFLDLLLQFQITRILEELRPKAKPYETT